MPQEEMHQVINWPPVKELLAQATPVRMATSAGNSDVYFIERDGRKFLIKTVARHNWFIRWFIGNIATAHEYKILTQLRQHGVTIAPEAYALLEHSTLVMEFLTPTEPLLSKRHYDDSNLPPVEYFQRLIQEMRKLHEIGFAHGDFRRANLLIDANGCPRIIDWPTASFVSPQRPGWRLLKRWIHRKQIESDNYSLAKIVSMYYPQILPPELSELMNRGGILQILRSLRQTLYRHGIKRWFSLTKHTQRRQ